MYLKPLFLLLFFLTSLTTSSQEINKGNILKDRQFLIDHSELTASDSIGNFVSIRPHRVNGTLRNYFVEFYDHMSFTNRVEIKTQNETKILDVFILNEKAHVFIKEEKNKSISLRCDVIDLKTQSYEQKSLLEADKNSTQEVYRALKNDFEIALEYSSKVVLSFPVIEHKSLYAFVKVFSDELEEINEHKIFADKSILNKNVSFLNAAQHQDKIYLLFNLIYSKDKKTYKLIELNSQKSLEVHIVEDSYELINSEIRASDYIISGLYSNHKEGGFKGFTHYTIDLDSFSLKSQQQTEFSNTKASKYFNGLFKGNRSIDIKDIFIDEQFNTYVVGQFYFMRKEHVNPGFPVGFPIATFTFGSLSVFITINPVKSYKVFDDILIGKINTKGELLWDTILELRQTEKINSKYNKKDSSTYTFFDGNQLNILMNGYINMDKEKLMVKQDKRFSKTNLYAIRINPKGKITPEILFANSDVIFIAETAVKSKNNIHILGQGNMRKQLLKIKF